MGRMAAGAFRAVPRLLLLIAWLSAGGRAGPETFSGEYEIKAAFLYNFAKYVEWPASAGPIVIAVFGQNPFGGGLEQMVQGKAVSGRPVIVQQPARLEELKRCQILFISASEKRRLVAILHAVRGEAVLTVSETEGFLERGGMVNFAVEENRVRFDVQLQTARQAGIRISARMLNLARLVRE